MPVTQTFTELVEVDASGVWLPVPARGLNISESRNGRIVPFKFDVTQTPDIDPAMWAALVMNARLRITQQVGQASDSFIGYITRRPRTRPSDIPTLALEGQDETVQATRQRFIDAWPKDGVRTVYEVLLDAWQRYGPASVALTGVQNITIDVDAITSNLETLYDLTEELARRSGADWRIRNGELQFWLPSTVIFGTTLAEDTNILPDSLEIGEEMPHIANVALVPAKVRIPAFEDKQLSRGGQAQYFLQYRPLTRQIQTASGTVYLDQPPAVYLAGVAKTAAEDGSTDAATAQCIYNVEEKFLRFTAGNEPAADGLEVKVIYTAEFPVIVRREHADSIALFGEIHERISRDPRPTRAEAEKIGDAFLRERALPIRPVKLATTEFGLRPGILVPVSIASEGLDQLMPVVEVERQTRPGQLDITVTLNQLPVTDAAAVLDLFRRINRLEASETSRQQRVELYSDWGDSWAWSEPAPDTVLFSCPLPAEDQYPSEVLYPC